MAVLLIAVATLLLSIQASFAYAPFKKRIEEAVSQSAPRTLYVSPQGQDSFDGTSVDRPWKTLARVNAYKFAPGDQILFEGGATFYGSLSFDQDDVATILRPIFVGSYGDGVATIRSGRASAISLTNTMGFRIANLHLIGDGATKNKGSGLRITNNLPGDIKLPSIQIENVEAEGFGEYGVVVDGNRGKSGFRNLTIDHVIAHNNALGGIVVNGNPNPFAHKYAHTNIRVSHSKAYDNWGISGSNQVHTGSGIILSDVQHGQIDHSESYANGLMSESKKGGPVGIWTWDSDDITIEFNHSHHNRVAGKKDGGGFDIDGWTTNSRVQYNYSNDNDGPGYLVCQFPSSFIFTRHFRNNIVRYNVSHNDARSNNYGSIHFFGGVNQSEVFNNTVVISQAPSSDPVPIKFEKNGANQISVRNNIFVANGNLNVVNVEAGQRDIIFQGNDYYSTGKSPLITWEGLNFNSLEQWRKKTGQEQIGNQKLGMNVNPDFQGDIAGQVNPDMLRLKTKSPLIDVGLDLSALFEISSGHRDFSGEEVPMNNSYDLGAFEAQPKSLNHA